MVKRIENADIDDAEVPAEAIATLKSMATNADAAARVECWTERGIFGFNRHTHTFYRWVLTDEDV